MPEDNKIYLSDTQTYCNNAGKYPDATNPIKKQDGKLAKEDIRILLGKIVLFIRKMPEHSRMKTPLKLQFKNLSVGFIIDKTDSRKTKIFIKDYYKNESDWNLKIPKQTTLHITLDEEGKLLRGEICTDRGLGISDYITFNRDKRLNRKIYYDGKTYVPHENGWSPIKNILMHEYIDELYPNNLLKVLLDCNFGNILLGLANMKLCLR